MAFVDRARLQRRLTTAAQFSYFWASLGLILVFLLWWSGRAGAGMAALGMGLAAGTAFLGYRTDEGNAGSALGLVALGAASVAYAFHYRPFTVDLLGLVATFYFLRGYVAARMLQGLDYREAAVLRKKEAKRSRKKGKPEGHENQG
jgi:hypothetical protein